MPKVQLDEELFRELVRYHLLGLTDDEGRNARICAGLKAKLDAAAQRERYGKVATAQTDAERDAARRDYMKNKAGR